MPAEGIVANRWYLNVQGIEQVTFKEVSGGDIEVEVAEHRETGPKGNLVIKKVPGNVKYSNIVMKRGMTDDTKLWDWIKSAINGEFPKVRKNGTLTQYAPDQKVIREITFTNGWPTKYKMPAVDSSKNEVTVEELEICVEKVEISK